MTFLTNEQVTQYLVHIEDLKLGIPFPIEKAQKIIDEFAQAPLVNVASKDDILRAVEKCANMSK